jgi:hypothetical protein
VALLLPGVTRASFVVHQQAGWLAVWRENRRGGRGGDSQQQQVPAEPGPRLSGRCRVPAGMCPEVPLPQRPSGAQFTSGPLSLRRFVLVSARTEPWRGEELLRASLLTS